MKKTGLLNVRFAITRSYIQKANSARSAEILWLIFAPKRKSPIVHLVKTPTLYLVTLDIARSVELKVHSSKEVS